MRPMYFDMQGQPMEMEAWARALEDIESRRIGQTFLPNGIRVSTVWLGLDHGSGIGRPLIFETMVFAPDGNDLECERYATQEEARMGHLEMVNRMMLKAADPD